ncbi:MAG: tetratricopeptide repeat protein [Candidatus Eisenbacteria bacterium]
MLQSWSILSVIAAQRGDVDSAIERSDRALAVAPTDVGLWINRGNLERLRGAGTRRAVPMSGCSSWRRRATRPSSTSVHSRRRPGTSPEAESRYRRVLSRRSDHPQTLYNLARLVGRNAEDEAIFLYDRAIEASPFHLDSWRNRAHLLRRVGRDDEAAASLSNSTRPMRRVGTCWRSKETRSMRRSHVTSLDEFAATYDHDFLERLGYEAARLAADVAEVLSDGTDAAVRRAPLRCGS